jgi:hypothetical protein
MTDQTEAEVKGKTTGLLRRVLWWLWVILLTALLALGLFFAAPWKALTLIAIFLTAATILPKIYRKWFWLSVGIIIIALVVWVFLPEDNEDWRPYSFDKEQAKLQARNAIPDSENAAIIYNQILADWKQKEVNEPNLPKHWFDLVKYGPWSSKDQPEIAAYMKYYHNTIEKVLQATSIQKCSFPVVTSYIDFSSAYRSPAMRRWSYLLIAAGNNDMAEGNTNEAVEKYLAALQLGQHEYQQPGSIDKLVGMACEALGLKGINNLAVLGDANEFYLDKLAKDVSAIKHDWNADLLNFITLDKFKLKKEFCGSFYEVNPRGKVRLSHDPSSMIREQIQKQSYAMIDVNKFPSGYWWKKLMKAYTIPYWFYMPATPAELSRIIDESYENFYAMTKPDFDWSKESEMPPEFHYKINIQQLVELMAKINKGVYPGLHDNYLRIAAQQKGTLLIIALRQYKNANGRWPQQLEDMNNLTPAEIFIDPINNDSFVYKLTNENFTLYSKGKNGIDEDGKYEYNWPAKPDADDLLIWPTKGKVSQQQEQKTEK